MKVEKSAKRSLILFAIARVNKMVDLENVKKEYDKLLQQLSDPELISDWERFKRLSERKNLLEKIIEKEIEIVEIKIKSKRIKQLYQLKKIQN